MPALRECVAGLTVPEEVILEARNRRGKPVRCRVSCTPLKDGDATRGAIIVMEEVPQLDGEGDGVLSDGRRAGVLEG